jgi:hypothetical protein
MAGRRYYSVSFKNETTGEYLPAISTKQEKQAAAIATAFQRLKEAYQTGRAGFREKIFFAGYGKRSRNNQGRYGIHLQKVTTAGIVKNLLVIHEDINYL